MIQNTSDCCNCGTTCDGYEYCCTACCLPCSQQLNEGCNQVCSDCCNELCGRFFEALCAGCAASLCAGCCGSSTKLTGCSVLPPVIIPLIGSITFTLLTVFILGVLQAFNPIGPFFLTMLAGSVLAVSLTGISFKKGTCKGNCESAKEKVCESVKTTWGRLTFIHSHHKPHLREAGHEFKIGNKYFCTGCYGTLIGTISALLLMSAYVLFGLTADLAFLVRLAIPICLIPIALRYAIYKQMRTPLRLLSNILLPIGSGLLFVLCDYTFHSWIVNVSLVLFILVISFVRITASSKENSAPETLPVLLPEP